MGRNVKELEISVQFHGRSKDALARAYGMGMLIQRIRVKIKAQTNATDKAGQLDLLSGL